MMIDDREIWVWMYNYFWIMHVDNVYISIYSVIILFYLLEKERSGEQIDKKKDVINNTA